ncbi:hypothetical protein ABPG75_001873 [Micractinium tetrahymenae]
MVEASAPQWEHLPSSLLLSIARLLAGGEGTGRAKTLLRLVCSGWRVSLPLGRCKIWDWQPGMDTALAPCVLHLELLAPLLHPTSGALPLLATCPHLHRLTLRHVRSIALPALAHLTRLQRLDATVLFTSAAPDAPGWLRWASALHQLHTLRLTAAVTWLQPEEGLAALLPLRRRMASLRLDGCVLLTDSGAAVLAQLSLLERLEATCCQLSQAGLDGLAGALPRLAHVELRLHDGMAADHLLRCSRVGAGGALTALVTRTKAASLLAAASRQMPGVARLAVAHLGGGFLLTSPPDFRQLTALTALSLPRVQLPPEAVRQLAACTSLRELEAELHFSVRDEALLGWAALGRLRRLRLCGSFYLSDSAMAAVLAAMPRLQELRLEQVQGSGAMLAPLAAMPHLRCLELAACHLNDGEALRAALCSATGLASLRVQSCGIQSEICDAVVAALRRLTGLREFGLGLRRAPPAPTAEAIALGCAACTQLTALDVHFPGYAPAPAVFAVPAWRQLRALSGLRRLHASTGVGWEADAFEAVLAAATALRAATITDNIGTVNARWAAALAPARQLSTLHLNSCRQLGADAAPLLCQLSSLTCLSCFRCGGLESGDIVRDLRAALPCLATLGMHD